MGTRSIDIMLSRAGIYVMVATGAMCLVEVDNDGRCFQLRLDDYRRDGELRTGGWMLATIEAIYGPFARAA